MTTKKTAPLARRTVGHSVGLGVAATIDRESDLIAGFRAGRNPELVALRKAHNERVVAQLIAEEMAKLQS